MRGFLTIMLAGIAWLAPGRPAIAQESGAASILDLQRQATVTQVAFTAGNAKGRATLYNFNPRINAWYLLRLDFDPATPPVFLHLENPAPLQQAVALDATTGTGLLLRQDLDEVPCELWGARPGAALEQAQRSRAAYAPLCDGQLYLRNRSVGYRTTRELVTDVLRDRVWGGERIISFVKDWLVRDSHLERADQRQQSAGDDDGRPGPLVARVAQGQAGSRPLPAGLGIEPELAMPGSVVFGRWYPARGVPDVYLGVMQAGAVEPSLLASHRDRVRLLDETEAEAVVYLAAFDLGVYELGFANGTDHPRVGWSERAPAEARKGNAPGPDGFAGVEPLVRTGIVSPFHLPRTVATFTGGFKRSHGAFRYGELAQRRNASHYGWIESGVIFSSLQPELATLLVMDGGELRLQTWQTTDEVLLPVIRHARQNGVPLIESDPGQGEPVPGRYVGNWGAGNWSGSASRQQRTVRGGACLQESDAGRYLVYAYFSSATPSAMARVFQAYRCAYAMLLDMNALEHTYLAVYRPHENGIDVQHLVRGMEEVDREVRGQPVPRFLGYADTRDFFYVMRRAEDG